MKFVDETEQKLNISLAQNMADELTPFLKDTLSIAKIKDKIHYMMVFNPSIEIYLLDESGKILAFFADPSKKVKKDFVDIGPIKNFINSSGEELIVGEDPRHPHRKKPFSAAHIPIGPNGAGYVYIILGSQQYDTVADMVRESYITQTSLKSFILILIVTGIIGLLLFAFITRRLHRLIDVIKKFESGKFNQRVATKGDDEIDQLGRTFNKMADTIVSNMDELKRTDNLRRELVANISHDLRSPLASMQGYLETISMREKSLSSEERNNYLEIIYNNTTLLSKLVEDLFELSKLDASQVKPNPEPFSISELIQDVTVKYKAQAEKNHINLEAVIPDKIPFVKADIGLIERAISNLLENALRFTPPKGSVKVALSNQTNGHLQVTVSDSGYGIAEEDLPYIFNRFYRAEKSRSREKGGTGLGLAISKKIWICITLHWKCKARKMWARNFILIFRCMSHKEELKPKLETETEVHCFRCFFLTQRLRREVY